MTYNTSATDALEDHLLKDREILPVGIESQSPGKAGLRHDEHNIETLRRHRSAASKDGVKAFMVNFAASSSNKEVAPATGDFRSAASFLFRK